MRTTLDIAEDILREIKGLARKSDRPVTEVANEVLRRGLAAMRSAPKKSRPYKESPADMGEPYVDLTKALGLATQLEDEEHVRELQLRK
ncbi:MAG TPA: hypothetical protein VIZ30_06655 [Pseudomonadales bacterium]